MNALAATPLRVLHPNKPKGNWTLTPVRDAFFLVDLENASSDNKEEEQFVTSRSQAWVKNKKISGEITWRMALRSDRHGILHPIARREQLFWSTKALAEKIVPMRFPIGMEFNLWWCRDRALFESVLGSNGEVQKEYQVFAASTMIDWEEKEAGIRFFQGVYANSHYHAKREQPGGDGPTRWQQHAQAARDRAEKAAAKITKQRSKYDRTTLYFGTPLTIKDNALNAAAMDAYLIGQWHYWGGGDDDTAWTMFVDQAKRSKVAIAVPATATFTEDSALAAALGLAAGIRKAARQVKDRNVFGYLAAVERVLQIIDTDKEKRYFNTIIEDARKDRSKYDALKKRLVRVPKRCRDNVEEHGKRLERLFDLACAQARWHHEPEKALGFIAELVEAMWVYRITHLRSAIVKDSGFFGRIERALRGQEVKLLPEEDWVKMVNKTVDWAGKIHGSIEKAPESLKKAVAGFVERSTKFIEALVPAVVKQKKSDAVNALRGLMKLVYAAEGKKMDADIAPASGKVKVTTMPKASIEAEQLAKKTGGPGFIARAGGLLNCANFIFTLRDTMNSGGFKNSVKLAGDTAQVMSSFEKTKDFLMKSFGVTERMLTRVAGAAAITVALCEAADHLSDGNNVAVFGDILSGVAGVITILTRGGTWGWVAALLVVVGAAIVYWSLDKNEKTVMGFNKKQLWSVESALNMVDNALSTYAARQADKLIKTLGVP